MQILLLLPAALQMLAMAVDELYFHRRRGLPRWERWGHPLDTLSAAACYGWLLLVPPAHPHALAGYVVLCAFSCLLITKDEIVHAEVCEPLEAWLHAVLFVLHPVVFLAFWLIWRDAEQRWLISVELALTLALFVHQVLYWSVIWPKLSDKSRS